MCLSMVVIASLNRRQGPGPGRAGRVAVRGQGPGDAGGSGDPVLRNGHRPHRAGALQALDFEASAGAVGRCGRHTSNASGEGSAEPADFPCGGVPDKSVEPPFHRFRRRASPPCLARAPDGPAGKLSVPVGFRIQGASTRHWRIGLRFDEPSRVPSAHSSWCRNAPPSETRQLFHDGGKPSSSMATRTYPGFFGPGNLRYLSRFFGRWAPGIVSHRPFDGFPGNSFRIALVRRNGPSTLQTVHERSSMIDMLSRPGTREGSIVPAGSG